MATYTRVSSSASPHSHPCSTPCSPNTSGANMQKDAEGSSANELVLRLVGTAKTCVMYDTTNMAHTGNNSQSFTHREMLREKKEILSYEVNLAAFGGKAASGSHNFPFSVMLPPGLPPSMKVQLPQWYPTSCAQGRRVVGSGCCSCS